MIPSYPKIHAIGSLYIPDLFKGPVEVTEKIDGSFFGFGLENDQLVMRSKGCELHRDAHDKNFGPAVASVLAIEDDLHRMAGAFGGNISIYAETLAKPKHNVLAYANVPPKNIIVFGIATANGWITDHGRLQDLAGKLGLITVPLLASGTYDDPRSVHDLLEADSILGNQKIEGVVVKNYNQLIFLGGHAMPSFGKLVADTFKERMKTPGERGRFVHGKGRFDLWLESFHAEPRWVKAVQHLRDAGKLIGDPKDIGALIREVKTDVITEEELNIKDELFKLFKEEIERKAVAGLPEWYKARLVEHLSDVGCQFDGGGE